MAVLLGLVVALTYGAADFFGGVSAQRAPANAVTATTQSLGLVLALAVVFLVGWDAVTGRDVALSAGAGVAQLVGVTALYRGLASGRMSVVAPVSAVTSAVIPVAWGLATGESPSVIALAGVATAIVAVGIVAYAPDDAPDALDTDRSGPPAGASAAVSSTIVLALLAGAAFGISFVCFGETGEDSGFWPVAIARAVAAPLLIGSLVVSGKPLLLTRAARPTAIAAGCLDMTANIVLLVAVRGELISLVAPVASLYPAGTVVLARLVLDEPIGRQRLAGLGLALVALLMIAT